MKKTDMDYAVFSDANITKEMLAKSIKTEIGSMMALCETIMREEKALNTIVDIFWDRYQEVQRRAKVAQPELPLEQIEK